MKGKASESFENIVHETLKEAGLLFPISDKEIESFESRFTNLPLPEKLKNANELLDRNRDKISAEKQPTFQVAALFDAAESPEPTRLTKNVKRRVAKKGKSGKGK